MSLYAAYRGPPQGRKGTILQPKFVHCDLNLCIATILRPKSVHCDRIATPNNWSLSCPVGGLYRHACQKIDFFPLKHEPTVYPKVLV